MYLQKGVEIFPKRNCQYPSYVCWFLALCYEQACTRILCMVASITARHKGKGHSTQDQHMTEVLICIPTNRTSVIKEKTVVYWSTDPLYGHDWRISKD